MNTARMLIALASLSLVPAQAFADHRHHRGWDKHKHRRHEEPRYAPPIHAWAPYHRPPPFAWVWMEPRWAWTGHSWVWQPGYWARSA